MFKVIRVLRDVKTSNSEAEFSEFLREKCFREDDSLCEWARELLVSHSDKLVFVADVDCSMDDLFRVTNSIECGWFKNDEVTVTSDKGFMSSSSIGDLFVNSETEEVFLFTQKGIVQLDNVSTDGIVK